VQMQQVLAENIQTVDQRFWLRIAEKSDAADTQEERDAIGRLASSIANTVEQLVQKADELLEDDASRVQSLLKVLANEGGDFSVPVSDERLLALREAIKEKGGALDDTFVATVKAYMSKADTDGLEGMVEVLRVLLQVFAAERLLLLASTGADLEASLVATLKRTLESSPDNWDALLRQELLSDDAECNPEAFLGALQDQMGEIVLGMPSGSALQNVLAEYLSELLSRARTISAEAA